MAEMNTRGLAKKGAKALREARVAEGDIGELLLDPLLGTTAHDHKPFEETATYVGRISDRSRCGSS